MPHSSCGIRKDAEANTHPCSCVRTSPRAPGAPAAALAHVLGLSTVCGDGEDIHAVARIRITAGLLNMPAPTRGSTSQPAMPTSCNDERASEFQVCISGVLADQLAPGLDLVSALRAQGFTCVGASVRELFLPAHIYRRKYKNESPRAQALKLPKSQHSRPHSTASSHCCIWHCKQQLLCMALQAAIVA
eukprot:1160124-Pelagomonas_calceolata.AAC.3